MQLAATANRNWQDTVWPLANLAIAVPITVHANILVKKLWGPKRDTGKQH